MARRGKISYHFWAVKRVNSRDTPQASDIEFDEVSPRIVRSASPGPYSHAALCSNGGDADILCSIERSRREVGCLARLGGYTYFPPTITAPAVLDLTPPSLLMPTLRRSRRPARATTSRKRSIPSDSPIRIARSRNNDSAETKDWTPARTVYTNGILSGSPNERLAQGSSPL